MTGIGISRKKPSGLRDWEKIPVGMAGLKNPIGDPPNSMEHNAQIVTLLSAKTGLQFNAIRAR